MLKIDVVVRGEFEVDVNNIRSSVQEVLEENSEDNVAVSVAVVSAGEMRKLVEKYYEKDNEEHPVLSFPNREVKEVFVEDEALENLGEIVLNAEYAGEHDCVYWAEHGALHLVGVHHD